MSNAKKLLPELVWINVKDINPNPWNPNRHTDDSFAQLVEETRRLNRPPKPIVVRKKGNRFEIVDGEHRLAAAIEAGLDEVPCEVIDVDDLEAMRRTYTQNQGGTADPLAQGIMFDDMKKTGNFGSVRQMARDTNIAESTLRHYLDYVIAYRHRERYTSQENAREEISKLTHREAKVYIKLANETRNVWLDAGADTFYWDWYPVGGTPVLQGPLVEAGLADVLDAESFQTTVKYAAELCEWREEHDHIEDVDSYFRLLAQNRMSAEILGYLPCCHENEITKVLLSPDEWNQILQKAEAETSTEWEQKALVERQVHRFLRAKGIDPDDIQDPDAVSPLRLPDDTPDCIRHADALTLAERNTLAEFTFPAPDEAIELAKRLTITYLTHRRGPAGAAENEAEEIDPALADISIPADAPFEKVLATIVLHLVHQAKSAQERLMFADRSSVMDAVLGTFEDADSLRDVDVRGVSALAVLRERLGQIPKPELELLTYCALTSSQIESAGRRWLDAVNSHEDATEASAADHMDDSPAPKEKG